VSLHPLAGAAPSAPGRQAGMFWVIEPLAPTGSAQAGSPQSGSTLTWHNGATGGYAAFLGLVRERRQGAAVLIDAARAADARRIALALLGSL
jgi:hypothetical protein